MIGSLLDGGLDRTVVGGYTSIGYRIRSRGWSAADLKRMDGKAVLVTGATAGLGPPLPKGSPGWGRQCGSWAAAASE